MRLHKVTFPKLKEWKKARFEDGQKKYKDSHLQRNGPVDVAEEIIDGMNIVELIQDRIKHQKVKYKVNAGPIANPEEAVIEGLNRVNKKLLEAFYLLQQVDCWLPDELCTDEKGGKRIYVNCSDGS